MPRHSPPQKPCSGFRADDLEGLACVRSCIFDLARSVSDAHPDLGIVALVKKMSQPAVPKAFHAGADHRQGCDRPS